MLKDLWLDSIGSGIRYKNAPRFKNGSFLRSLSFLLIAVLMKGRERVWVIGARAQGASALTG